jgi:hypothetical protein
MPSKRENESVSGGSLGMDISSHPDAVEVSDEDMDAMMALLCETPSETFDKPEECGPSEVSEADMDDMMALLFETPCKNFDKPEECGPSEVPEADMDAMMALLCETPCKTFDKPEECGPSEVPEADMDDMMALLCEKNFQGDDDFFSAQESIAGSSVDIRHPSDLLSYDASVRGSEPSFDPEAPSESNISVTESKKEQAELRVLIEETTDAFAEVIEKYKERFSDKEVEIDRLQIELESLCLQKKLDANLYSQAYDGVLDVNLKLSAEILPMREILAEQMAKYDELSEKYSAISVQLYRSEGSANIPRAACDSILAETLQLQQDAVEITRVAQEEKAAMEAKLESMKKSLEEFVHGLCADEESTYVQKYVRWQKLRGQLFPGPGE